MPGGVGPFLPARHHGVGEPVQPSSRQCAGARRAARRGGSGPGLGWAQSPLSAGLLHWMARRGRAATAGGGQRPEDPRALAGRPPPGPLLAGLAMLGAQVTVSPPFPARPPLSTGGKLLGAYCARRRRPPRAAVPAEPRAACPRRRGQGLQLAAGPACAHKLRLAAGTKGGAARPARLAGGRDGWQAGRGSWGRASRLNQSGDPPPPELNSDDGRAPASLRAAGSRLGQRAANSEGKGREGAGGGGRRPAGREGEGGESRGGTGASARAPQAGPERLAAAGSRPAKAAPPPDTTASQAGEGAGRHSPPPPFGLLQGLERGDSEGFFS